MAVDQSLVVFGNYSQIPIYKKYLLFGLLETVGGRLLIVDFLNSQERLLRSPPVY